MTRAPDKSMVCDHCRSHGLPCNESPVCEQCILHEVACVHHVCQLSPDSREDCQDGHCHYVHNDHMPCRLDDPEYLLMPGLALRHDVAGHRSKFIWPGNLQFEKRRVGIERRQDEALEHMRQRVLARKCAWYTVTMTCKCLSLKKNGTSAGRPAKEQPRLFSYEEPLIDLLESESSDWGHCDW